MGHKIEIDSKGKYNVWSTVVDAYIYNGFDDLHTLKKYYRADRFADWLEDFEIMFERMTASLMINEDRR